MDKKNILFLSLFVLLCFGAIAQDNKANFPKKNEYPGVMPKAENFWIFIMAGQSNMAGRGIVEPEDTVPNSRILTINLNNEWVIAKEPLHQYQPKLTGLDGGVSFARELLNHIADSVTIGLVPCAVGGSPIQAWAGDSVFNGVQLFSNFKEKTKTAMQYGIVKGILWHQGESDAFDDKIPVYDQQLKHVLTNMRRYIGDENLSIIMGELGAFTKPKEWQDKWNTINEIIRQVARDLNDCYVVPTDDLTCNPDSVHFNNVSQRILGKRYAEKFISIQEDLNQ